MIIERLQSENVLKYARLDLDGLPERGLIAVIGDNESGKSSIGESICFALFGRTFSLGPDELDKVIRWGESRCAIKLNLRTPDGSRYQVARFLDELGSHGASISRPGEPPLVRGVEAVAERLKELIGFGYTEFIESFYLAQREISTPKPHSDAVKAMAGIDALEGAATQCQREAGQYRTDLSETVREAADIEGQIAALGLDPERLATLEQDLTRTQDELAAQRETIRQRKAELEQTQRAIVKASECAAAWLAVEPQASLAERHAQADSLAELVRELAPACEGDGSSAAALGALRGLAESLQARVAAFDTLAHEADLYRDRLAQRLGVSQDSTPPTPGAAQPFGVRLDALEGQARRLNAQRAWARGLGILLALGGLAAALLWFLLTPTPDSAPLAPISARLGAWIDGLAGWPWRARLDLLAQAGAGAGLAALTLLLLAGRQGRRLDETERVRHGILSEQALAEAEYADLGRLAAQPLPEGLAHLAALTDQSIAARVGELLLGPAGDLVDGARYPRLREEFRHTATALVAGLTQARTRQGLALDDLHESVAAQTATVAGHQSLIAAERERHRRHRELSTIAVGLAAKQADLGQRLRIRELAVDLLAGAIRYISQRFNTEVRNLCAGSLPKFTNGRYQHLQIDQDLKVKAFSNEKRDFMALDEISSGTQRQIMLAVRMALSQKLVNSAIRGPQCLFLDEPFAFFDETRTASALAVLPQVSPDFTQIWVTSQTFPARSRFDLVIACNARESESPRLLRPADLTPPSASDAIDPHPTQDR